MKKIIVIIGIVVLLLIGGIYVLKPKGTVQINPPSPTPTVPVTIAEPTGNQTAFCPSSHLLTSLTLEGAAGTTYGSLSITNTSVSPCQIQGDQFVQASYTTKNIQVEHLGSPGEKIMTLAPNQTVYSQIRYPNGAQCSGPTLQSSVSFSYPISPTESIGFSNETRDSKLYVRTCSAESEQTTIKTGSLSEKPANQ